MAMRSATDGAPVRAEVVVGLDDAVARAGQGHAVVLLVPPGSSAEARAGVTELPGPGRVALFVGDPGSPQDRAAAQAMADELFGGR
jgi:hypothetical protein